MTSSIGVTDDLKNVAKDCAMQAVAMKPSYFNEAEVPAEVIESEKNIMLEQMNNDPKMASKPDKVKENIVAGKVKKYYSENCLVDQEFVKDSSFTITTYIKDAAKKANADYQITAFARFECGDGIEKKDDNFADEVSSMIK
jgi:elongation factor Ts